MRGLIFGCILLAGCKHSAHTDVSGTPSNAKECKIPSSWTNMNANLSSPADELVVLDWRVRSDAPMLVNEEAFIWYRGHEDAGAYWYLTTLYRHPKDDNKWQPAIVYDAPILWEARFDHAPTNEDVASFLDRTMWRLQQQPPEDTAGRRCNATWTRVIGAPPPPLVTP